MSESKGSRCQREPKCAINAPEMFQTENLRGECRVQCITAAKTSSNEHRGNIETGQRGPRGHKRKRECHYEASNGHQSWAGKFPPCLRDHKVRHSPGYQASCAVGDRNQCDKDILVPTLCSCPIQQRIRVRQCYGTMINGCQRDAACLELQRLFERYC